MVGCKGAALSVLQEEDPDGNVRFSTVQCGMTRTLKENCHALIPLFQNASHVLGQHVHVAGLVSNWLMTQNPTEEIKDWKHYYDQIFSAMEGGKNCYSNAVQEFLSGIKDKLPPKVDFELRQEQTAEMAESAKLHLKSFKSRLIAYLKHRVLDLQIQRLGKIVCSTISGQDMCERLHSGKDFSADTKKKLLKLATNERFTLLSIISEVIHDEKQCLNELSICDDKEKTLYKRIVHLQRYSNWNLDWWSRYKDRLSLWAYPSNPEPFSLLPFFKLQPRLIHYTWSVFYKGFLRWSERNEKDSVGEVVRPICDAMKPYECKKPESNHKRWKRIMDKKKTATTNRKRKNSDMQVERFVCDVWFSSIPRERIKRYAQQWIRVVRERKMQLLKHRTILYIMSQLFDLKHVKQRHRADWKLASFRTDGVCLCITFATTTLPSAPNVDALVKSGYNLPEVEEKVDIFETKRGIFRLTEERNDLSTNTDCTNRRVDIVPLDPGCVKPLQGAVIPSTECTSLNKICTFLSNHEADSLWHLTAENWKLHSGRTAFEKHETYIRQKNPLYDEAIKELRDTRKKSASKDALNAYCSTLFKHLDVMVKQLVTIHKSRVRWKQIRKTTSWLSKVANKVFNQEKGHTKKEEQSVKRVAFLGDGTFKHKKGHAPVPKKKLAKVLATKGLTVMLDEFYTSKQCPCGGSELEDNPDTSQTEDLRLRRHKTIGQNGNCCVECTLGADKMDRDVLAITNFLLCVKCALGDESRPNHLCRPWRVHSR